MLIPSLMAADEEFTHERLKEYLHELVGPRINQHHGRLVKNTGDRMLAEFSSVVDAVRSAAEIQYGIPDRNPNTLPGRGIVFRMGITAGDVIAEPEDQYGDQVNVAARLGSLAEPGA